MPATAQTPGQQQPRPEGVPNGCHRDDGPPYTPQGTIAQATAPQGPTTAVPRAETPRQPPPPTAPCPIAKALEGTSPVAHTAETAVPSPAVPPPTGHGATATEEGPADHETADKGEERPGDRRCTGDDGHQEGATGAVTSPLLTREQDAEAALVVAAAAAATAAAAAAAARPPSPPPSTAVADTATAPRPQPAPGQQQPGRGPTFKVQLTRQGVRPGPSTGLQVSAHEDPDIGVIHHAVHTDNLAQLVVSTLYRLTWPDPTFGVAERLLMASDHRLGRHVVLTLREFPPGDEVGPPEYDLGKVYASPMASFIGWIQHQLQQHADVVFNHLPARVSFMIQLMTGVSKPNKGQLNQMLGTLPSADSMETWATCADRAPLLSHYPDTYPLVDPMSTAEIEEVYHGWDAGPGNWRPQPDLHCDGDGGARALRTEQQLRHHRHGVPEAWGWSLPPAYDECPATGPFPNQSATACPGTPRDASDSLIIAQAVWCNNLGQLVLSALTRLARGDIGPAERLLLTVDPFPVALLATRHFKWADRQRALLRDCYSGKTTLNKPLRLDWVLRDVILNELPQRLRQRLSSAATARDLATAAEAVEAAAPSTLDTRSARAWLQYAMLWPWVVHHNIPRHGPLGGVGAWSALCQYYEATPSMKRRGLAGFPTLWTLSQLTVGFVSRPGAIMYGKFPDLVRCVTAALHYGLTIHNEMPARACAKAITNNARDNAIPDPILAATAFHYLYSNQGLQWLCVLPWLHEILDIRQGDYAMGLLHDVQHDTEAPIRCQLQQDRVGNPLKATDSPDRHGAVEGHAAVQRWMEVYNVCRPLLHGRPVVDSRGRRLHHRADGMDAEEDLPRERLAADITELQHWRAQPPLYTPTADPWLEDVITWVREHAVHQHAQKTEGDHVSIPELPATLLRIACKDDKELYSATANVQTFLGVVGANFGGTVATETLRAVAVWRRLGDLAHRVAPGASQDDDSGDDEGDWSEEGDQGGGGDNSHRGKRQAVRCMYPRQGGPHHGHTISTHTRSGEHAPPPNKRTRVIEGRPRSSSTTVGAPLVSSGPIVAVRDGDGGEKVKTTGTEKHAGDDVDTPPTLACPEDPTTVAGTGEHHTPRVEARVRGEPPSSAGDTAPHPRTTPAAPHEHPQGNGGGADTHQWLADIGADCDTSGVADPLATCRGSPDQTAADAGAAHREPASEEPAGDMPATGAGGSDPGTVFGGALVMMSPGHVTVSVLVVNLGAKGWNAKMAAIDLAERHRCDVVVASETKLSAREATADGQHPLISTAGNKWIVAHKPHRSKSGGIAIAAQWGRHDSLFDDVTVEDDAPLVSALLLRLQVHGASTSLYVCGAYLPPPGPLNCGTDRDCTVAGCGLHHVQATIDHLKVMAARYGPSGRFILAGDLNADARACEGTTVEQERHLRWQRLSLALGMVAAHGQRDAGAGAPTRVPAAEGPGPGGLRLPLMMSVNQAFADDPRRPLATRPSRGKKAAIEGTTTSHVIISDPIHHGLEPLRFSTLQRDTDQLSDHLPLIAVLRLRHVPLLQPRPCPPPAACSPAPVFNPIGQLLTTPARQLQPRLTRAATTPPRTNTTQGQLTSIMQRCVTAPPRQPPQLPCGPVPVQERDARPPPTDLPADCAEGVFSPDATAPSHEGMAGGKRPPTRKRALHFAAERRDSGSDSEEAEAELAGSAPAGGNISSNLQATPPAQALTRGESDAAGGAGAQGAPAPLGVAAAPEAPPEGTCTVRIFSANIGGGGSAGWRAHVAMAAMTAIHHGAHVMVVQETHLSEGMEAVLPPGLWSGAKVFRTSRPGRTVSVAWGGVAIIANLGGDLGVTELSLDDECTNCDVLWVKLCASSLRRPVYICGAYLPPSGMPSTCPDDGCCADPTCAYNHPTQGMLYISATAPERAQKGIVIIAGDLNADCQPASALAPHRSPAQRRWGQLKEALGIGATLPTDDDEAGATALAVTSINHCGLPPGLTPEPTRTTSNGRPTTLDYVLHCQHPDIVDASLRTLPDHISDHKPLLATLQLRPAPPRPTNPRDAAPRPVWTRIPLTRQSFSQRTAFQHVPLDGSTTAALRTSVDEWHKAMGPATTGVRYRTGVYAAIEKTLNDLRRAQHRRVQRGLRDVSDPVAVQLHATMIAAHVALRRYKAQQRDAVQSQMDTRVHHERGEASVSNLGADDDAHLKSLVGTYSAARAALNKHLRHSMQQAARARTDEYLAAVARGDAREQQRVLRAALPAGKGGAINPLGRLATTMDTGVEVTARDVVTGEEAAGMDRRAVAQLAAARHASALAKQFTELGVADPVLSSRHLRTQIAVVEAALRGYGAAGAPTTGAPSYPPEGRTATPSPPCRVLQEPDITQEEVLCAVTQAKTTPSTLGTSMAALVAVFSGEGEQDVARREVLAAQLTEDLRRGEPDEDATGTVVTPIHKGGDPYDCSNYRTIAVAGALPKVLFLVLKQRLDDHILGTGLIHPLQAGFQRGRGTDEHLLLALLLQSRGRRSGRAPVTLFLDVRKAYGSVNHDILLGRLWQLGIRGCTWLYLHNMLRRLTMQVKVDGQLSAPFPAQRGVPEGNNLSTSLFLVYIDPVIRAADTVQHPDAGVTVSWKGGTVRTVVSIRAPALADDIRCFASSTAGMQALADAVGEALIDIRLQANMGVAKTAYFNPPPEGTASPAERVHLPAQAVAGQWEVQEVEVSNAAVYRYLGLHTDALNKEGEEGPGAGSGDDGGGVGRPQYATHRARLVALSNRSLHSFATSGICGLPPAVATQAYNTLVLPKITYGVAVWGGMDMPAALRANEKCIARMIARVGPGTLPTEALFAVTGVARLDDAYTAGVLRSVVMVCRAPRDSALRLLAVRELLDWQQAPPKEREGMWAHDVMQVLEAVDEAVKWNVESAPCPHGVEPTCRPEGVAPVPQPATPTPGWRATVLRVLFAGGPGQQDLPTTEEQALVSAMYGGRRQALDAVRLRRRVLALWQLPSLRDVAYLSARLRPPPFAHLRRTQANRLRTLARGGARCLLGWSTYDAVRTMYDGAPACPLCGLQEGLTVTHLVGQCSAMTGTRHRVWLLGYKHAQLHAATGTGWLVPAAPDPGSDTGQAWWLALTLGDEVGALPGDRHGAQWRQSGYAALLGITGALLVEVVEAVKARVGPIPETASSDSGIDSDPE